MKVAFLDRDGTINREYPDEQWRYVTEPEILKGSFDGMRYLSEKGYKIIIVTNQYPIGEGVITQKQYLDFTERLLALLSEQGVEVLDVFYCPHARSDGCYCMKPKTGMIRQALEKYPDIDLCGSFMCGDQQSDMLFAQNAGLRFFGIGFGEEKIDDLGDLRYIL